MPTIAGPGLYSRSRLGTGIFRPERLAYGVNDGAGNVTKIRAAITAAGAYFTSTGRKGIVPLDQRGEFPLGGTPVDNSSYEASTKYLVADLPSGVRVVGEKPCRFVVDDGVQTDATGQVHAFVVSDKTDITFEGEAEFDMNSQGQTGWTGGYNQNSAGMIRGYAPSTGLHRINIEDWGIDNCLGNPVNMGTAVASSWITYRRLKCRTFGEGPQTIGCVNSYMIDCELYDYGTLVGDWYEIANGIGGAIKGCKAFGKIGHTTTGAMIDLQSCQNVNVSDCYGSELAGLYNSTNVGGTPVNNTLHNMVFDNCPGAAFFDAGIVTLSKCTFNRCGSFGNGTLYINNVAADIRVSDCHFNNCYPITLQDGKLYLSDSYSRANATGQYAIIVKRSNAFSGTQPTLHIRGGRHTGSDNAGGTTIMVDGNGNGAIVPVIRTYGTDLRAGPTGVSYGSQNSGSLASKTDAADVLTD